MKSSYGSRFYASRHEDTRYAADRVLGLVLDLTRSRSVLDIGCGVGTWLGAARDRGIRELFGLEGEWLDRSQLVVEISLVECRDLEAPFELTRRFDLALCLEVAEHLSPARAPGLVADLVRAADAVLFSAAIPDQGGVAHVNEQWQSYWARLFAGHGYDAFDVVRSALWSDERIPFWYRQNTLLYLRKGCSAEAHVRGVLPLPPMLDVVHPQLYVDKLQPGPLTMTRLTARGIRRLLGWSSRSDLPAE